MTKLRKKDGHMSITSQEKTIDWTIRITSLSTYGHSSGSIGSIKSFNSFTFIKSIANATYVENAIKTIRIYPSMIFLFLLYSKL